MGQESPDKKENELVTTRKPSEALQALIVTALTCYYRGEKKLPEALKDHANMSKSAYYRIKQDHAAIVGDLDRRARVEALLAKSGKQLHLESHLQETSLSIQIDAAKGVLSAIPAVVAIALGESRFVTMTNKAGEEYEKQLPSYQRDIVAAVKLLQELGRGGTLPEVPTIYAAGEQDGGGGVDPAMLLAPPPHDFDKVVATAPDGTKLTLERPENPSPDIVDGEFSEVEEDDVASS